MFHQFQCFLWIPRMAPDKYGFSLVFPLLNFIFMSYIDSLFSIKLFAIFSWHLFRNLCSLETVYNPFLEMCLEFHLTPSHCRCYCGVGDFRRKLAAFAFYVYCNFALELIHLGLGYWSNLEPSFFFQWMCLQCSREPELQRGWCVCRFPLLAQSPVLSWLLSAISVSMGRPNKKTQ